MHVLVFGDTVGRPGREACKAFIPELRRVHDVDLVVVNGENLAHGSSLTTETARELFSCGVDVITTGDHIFKKQEATEALHSNPNILRPVNYPAGTPGRGHVIVTTKKGVKVAVINLMGRVFMPALDCPFQTVDAVLKQIQSEAKIVLVDFHAEATSEKVAMGWHLDGRVSAVYGTHTHIQTADESILPRGTAYMTELGMCGPYRSVIGRDIDQVLHRFRTQMPGRMEVASDDARISGALIEINAESGRAHSIKRIHERLDGAHNV
ncbi:MAG: metallophosphoesterase [Omnitrophica bacterium RIFCSPLOWO2_01_FULL_50_24]|nr:MAG: metallophosphoesterase [Omnitrophica bacterium RIFCSPLOWO2_01_FULL_50_24]